MMMLELPITQDYLILTEKITTRPMLRTRFTTQAYLVLATFLDLRDQHLLTLTPQQVTIPDPDRLQAALPASLQELVTRLRTAVTASSATADVFKLLVSWNLANAIYDTVGPQLAATQQVEPVVFQNNLLPHTIYVPQEAAKQRVIKQLEAEIRQRRLTPAHQDLLAIFDRLQALQWLLPADLVTQWSAAQSKDTTIQQLTALAQHRITMRKFELDSWLS